MDVNSVFSRWAHIIESDPGFWSRFPGRYLWEISGPTAAVWLLDVSGEAVLRPSHGEQADFCIRMDSRNFLELARGSLNPQLAFLNGQITVRGRTKYALRFNLLLDQLVRVITVESGHPGAHGQNNPLYLT